MPVVQAGDQVIEFPESMSSEDIQSALKERFTKKEEPQKIDFDKALAGKREISDKSVLGISPEMVPSGAGTRAPWLTIPLSVAGKTVAGIGGYITSPQGAGELAAAATPAAPAIFAKWAFDMLRGGYKSTKAIVGELGQMANEALNKGIISANQLGPVPEGKTTQEHIQSIAENAANAALMTVGGLGAVGHAAKYNPEVESPDLTRNPQEEKALLDFEKQNVPQKPLAEPAPSQPAVEPTPTEISKAPSVEQDVTKPVTEPVVAIQMNDGTIVQDSAVVHHAGLVDKYGLDVNKVKSVGFVKGETYETGGGLTFNIKKARITGREPTDINAKTTAPSPEASAAAPVGPGTIGKQEMGAAGIEEPLALASGTGLKNAVAEIERTGLGLGDAPETVKRNMAKAWVESGNIEASKPGTGANLSAMLQRDPDMGLTDTESALLLRHKVDLFNKMNDAAERSNVGDAAQRKKAAAEHELFRSDFESLLNAVKKRGTEWGREGRWRQAMAKEDFTFTDTDQFNRYYRNARAKDLPENKLPKAGQLADRNKKAQSEENAASEKLNKRIRQKPVPPAEQAALDAAARTVRNAAESMANAENKARSAEEVRQQAENQVQKDALEAAEDAKTKTARSEAVRRSRAENKARVEQAKRDKQVADIEVNRSKAALDAAQERQRRITEKARKEAYRRANDPSIAVWELAKKYLDENKGLYGFDDLRNKIAMDLKMQPSEVARWMAKDLVTKRLADDLWAKQRNARRLKEQAKIWLRELDTPGYQKALASIPRFMFSASVFGHGFVALGTHAPIVAFQPRFWNAYVRNFGKMYKMVFSPAYYEMQMQDLVRRPNYDVARRSGLQNDPFKYEEYHTVEIANLVKDWIGEKNMDRIDKFASAGNRGYGVLKLLRQDMFDQRYNKLPDSIRKQEGVTEGMADDINHATGVTKKQAFKGSNLVLFAPRLAGSRVMWLGGDPVRASIIIGNWKNASVAEKQFAINQLKEKAWVAGTFASILAMNQGFLSAAGSKQKINGIPESLGGAGFDPLASDFLKFKALGGDIAYGGALLTLAKLPVRVATAILYEGKGSKYVLEDDRVDKVVGSYIRSQMAPFAGTITDLATGRDYEERPLPAKMFGMAEQPGAVPKRLQAIGVDEPYNWLEYTGTKLPIPAAEALKEGLRASGMADNQVNPWLKAIAVGSLMSLTGTRITEDTREE